MVEGLRDEYLFYATDPDGDHHLRQSVAICNLRLHRRPGDWAELARVCRHGRPGSQVELEQLEQMRFAGIRDADLFIRWVPHVNGEIRLFEFRDMPVRDRDGRVIANEGIGKDVTLRHEAEKAFAKPHRGAGTPSAGANCRAHRQKRELRKARSDIARSSKTIWNSSFVGDDDGVRTFVNDSYCTHSKRHRRQN